MLAIAISLDAGSARPELDQRSRELDRLRQELVRLDALAAAAEEADEAGQAICALIEHGGSHVRQAPASG